jgi:hypothetical protein
MNVEESNPRFAEGRQYREYVVGVYRAAGAEWLGTEPGRPQEGDAWGPWVYQKENLTLQYAPRDGHWWYEVDLEKCVSSAAILDRIFQIRSKREDLVSAEDIGHLVAALNDLLQPQANVCSFGRDSQFDTTTYLTTDAADRSIDLEGHVTEMLRSGAIKITTFEGKQ